MKKVLLHRARVLLLALLALAASPVWAVDCSDFPGGVIDGFAGTPAPDQVQIDRTCTIRNYPASNPLRTNFSFLTQPGQTDERWLIIFDNVVHTGQMACNAVAGHKIWFTNGSSTSIQEGCQNLLIPVEKIDKQTPPGQTAASVGVPFTYRLTMPVLFDSGTGVVINASGSLNDLHGVTLSDDLNATGADLSYVSHTAYWEDTGAPVPHTFANANGLLTFDNFPIVPAGRQIVIELTVVLEDTPGNVIGTQFVNTAKWDFGRLIDGVFYEPLPGEWGISEPMTIAGPELVLSKSGPASLNLGQWADFTLDVQNTGNTAAWNATLVDRLPDGASGGMCDLEPEVLGAGIFQADGVTPVAGKEALVAGTDFLVSYSGAPACELRLRLRTAAAAVGPDERLIVTYRTRLDDDSENGIALTNVAAATGWFNDGAANPDRQAYTRAVSDGTVGTEDHEDAHTLTTALSGFFFEKTVANLTSGENPAQTGAPGDRMRYTLRLRTTDTPLTGARILDDLGALNARAVFEPGSLVLRPGDLPPGANTAATDPLGGVNSAGLVDISNLFLPVNSELSVEFDVTLRSSLVDGSIVANQAELLDGVKIADSDDPNVNGLADPDVPGDEDPTVFMIETAPPDALAKATTQPTAAVGERFRYRITVPSAPHTAPLYDVRVLDDLTASAADLQFVDVVKVSGPGSWVPANTGSASSVVIEGSGSGMDIPAGEQIVLDVTVQLLDTPTNVAGLTFTNTAAFSYNQLDEDDSTQRAGSPIVSGAMTIVEPELTLEKSGPLQLLTGVPGSYLLNVQNVGEAPAFGAVIVDVLPSTAAGGQCDAAPTGITAQLFEADGVTPAAPALSAGSDFTVSFNGAPACTLTLSMLTPAAAIGPDQRLIVGYQAALDAGSQQDTPLTNVAGATEWLSGDPSGPADELRRATRALTDGSVGVLDHEDAHTGVVFAGRLMFEKTAVNLTSGEAPATTARPGDRLRYSLRIENVGDVVVEDFSVVDELDRLNAQPAFQRGTLSVVTLPSGASAGGTDPAGGASGTGALVVDGLDLGLGETVLIEFEVQLAPVLANASYVANQSQITIGGYPVAQSDDPNVNGQAAPLVVGDEDPTRVQIQSAPEFEVNKISNYVDGDPSVLLAGETLRYTLTVRNIGDDNAVDARLRDALPANTTYVAGSTTLNGSAVADGSGGAFPLSGGLDLFAPGDPAPGVLRADPSGRASDAVATLQFDVVVDGSVADGTVISNQAFVSALAGGVVDQPSDDPRTATEDDPTRDVVGNFPLIFAEKAAALQVDDDTLGIVDPGDYLRYTIQVHNNGAIPATVARLVDVVPTDTTYVADSLTLNGIPVGQPDGGTFPLEAGVWISSADLTPPAPGANEGVLSPGETATIQFDVRVNDGVARGTLITNQATVTTEELGAQLTDGDGNPATGPEPTIVVVGDAQALAVTKQVAVVGGGPALAGATVEYLVTVQNIGAVAATDVYVTDDLDAPVPGQLLYIDQSATLNGEVAGISLAGPVITANYSARYGALQPGQSFALRFQAQIDPDLPIGTAVANVAQVTWNTDQTASAGVTLDVGGTPGAGRLNGTVWHDADFDDLADSDERLLEGWIVELRRNDRLIYTGATDAAGAYQISGLVPNYETMDRYELNFRAPGAGTGTALLGLADSDFTNDLQRISDIVVSSGSNLQNLNLPIEPNGVVYDSVTRTPLRGVTLNLRNEATSSAVPDICFDDPAQQGQVTPADGYYRFDLNFSDPACPSGGAYVIEVVEPGAAFTAGYSEIIPPARDETQPPFDVPACPGGMDDVVPATADRCEVQMSELAPGSGVPAQSPGTTYHVRLLLRGDQIPGSSQLFNNHIPLDPVLDGVVTITKTTPMVNVTRGQMVPYTITVNNAWPVDLTDVDVVDRYPVGFKYIEGSARLDGEPVEPSLVDRQLVWENLTLQAEGRHTIQLLLAPGAGVAEGKYTNRAQAMHRLTGSALSGEAGATVRLVPDPTFDCTDVTGKVFDDDNRNGIQEEGEFGLAGVRLVTPRGLAALTDDHGRFHITCAITPREGRGSNFMLKLDDRTLPSGYRASTDAFQVKRATRGKALHFSFGASIHRVIGLDIADPVFEPGGTEMRPQWRPRVNLLLEELQKAPSVLRLSYLADVEEPRLVERRVKSLTDLINDAWQELDCCYRLVVEHEVFWRMGKPPAKDARFSAMREADQ